MTVDGHALLRGLRGELPFDVHDVFVVSVVGTQTDRLFSLATRRGTHVRLTGIPFGITDWQQVEVTEPVPESQ